MKFSSLFSRNLPVRAHLEWAGADAQTMKDEAATKIERFRMTLTAKVPTTSGSRYLQQLCKHWSHKFETEFDAGRGTVALPMGALRMSAEAEALIVTIDPEEGADVDRFKQVVADHLDRFAFREAPLPFDWR